MLKLFKGELSIAVTFWVGFFLFNVVTNLILVQLNNQYLTIEDDQTQTLDTVILVFMIFLLLYLLLMIVAMYRSMHKEGKASILAWIGLLVICLAVIFRSYNIALVAFPTIIPSDAFIDIEIAQLNQSLPTVIGDGMTMTKVTLEDGVMSYIITADFLERDFAVINLIEAPIGQNLCRDFEGYFNGPVNSVAYVYNLIDGQMTSILTAEECLSYLQGTR
ncbi:hypothetical protein [Parasulfitobacter algicola]|uniref:Uncharacterized protein n=1 Tax=Parasulfitobacter algicola TaxID=2614809 RepID=A0ABX2J0Q5_9RHOB|nr:hypothetical protein [Sulfitobacter algicola]NSX56363.1 hypothetical protein [Sulfitobacter algicola]